MNRMWVFLLVVAYPVIIWAQTGSRTESAPYQPAVPAGNTVNSYGGYPGYSGGGTAAGNAMNGMANAISAKGNYNLSTSAAAINMTQAQKNEIENRQLYTDTYFQMRATNKAAREKEAGPKPTMEQIARMARDGAPRPLKPNQVDPVSGQINWPGPLQDDSFQDERSQIEQLFSTRSRYGGLTYADQTKFRQITDSMFQELKGQIRQIPPSDYVACQNLLRSLKYTATKSELD